MTDSVALSVSVNGDPRSIAAGTTLEALVATLTAAPSGVAAAVNESVVPRSRWSSAALADGDRIEVLTAVQGG
ncbi:sulfur carrier protein ThiS [Streptomyces sp. NBC_01727]|uniref:sulfur carrier protein ThiS n=1 Tax=unclassified Streptomyces TaxID=2593676 RepID=UPI002E0EF455|nr:sulfur carrier protein ThiS [Streptomyces sp. NBC_01727]